jgi:hypothetical protein
VANPYRGSGELSSIWGSRSRSIWVGCTCLTVGQQRGSLSYLGSLSRGSNRDYSFRGSLLRTEGGRRTPAEGPCDGLEYAGCLESLLLLPMVLLRLTRCG